MAGTVSSVPESCSIANALVDAATAERLESLPDSARVKGDAVPLAYEIRAGEAVARLTLREGQARRIRAGDLPTLDRPIVFAVRRGAHPPIMADSLEELQRLLQRQPPRVSHDDGPPQGRRGGHRQRHQRGSHTRKRR